MTKANTNTGQGGFDVDGQTYVYDVGVSEAQGGSQGPSNKEVDVSKSYVDPSGKPKDLTKKTKTTLSQYLSKQTNGQGEATRVPNRYPIDPNPGETSVTAKDGQPALQTPGAPRPANSTSFAPTLDEVGSYTHEYPSISSQIKKGKGQSAGKDGNDLLPGVSGDSSYVSEPGKQAGVQSRGIKALQGHPDTTGVIKGYVSAVLSNNRFSSAGTNTQRSFTETGAESEAGFNPVLPKQGLLGSYDPTAQGLTAGRMATVGPLLTMRASMELGATEPGANPNSGPVQAQALLPGLTQLGIERIEQQVLLASDVINTLTTDELNDVNVINPNGLSWGQLNNVNDPFSGTDALGMLALSTALVAGIELLIDGLSVLLGLVTPSLKRSARDSQGRYSLGEYLPGSKQAKKKAAGGLGGALSALTSLNFGGLLGIQPTNYPFNRALTTGMNAFFGIPDDNLGGIGLNQLVGALTSSADSPGFNVVVARAIIRSSLTIADEMKKIGGNAMNAINQVLSLVDTIRSSKLVSACNVFASLGDQILSSPEIFIDKDTTNVKISTIDSRSDLQGDAVSKNRLKGTLKLAWASNTAPANILLPASIIGAGIAVKNVGQFSPYLGVRQDPFSRVQSTVTTKDNYGRIPAKVAWDFENKLDASYVPFYFHDIRTNEMVAFHAFLASLTDDYTASYDKPEAFGRVESIKIYKGTDRRINMSFYIVATSPLDFDEMYLKINKLVTLVFPQYTQGIQLSSSDDTNYKFTQPFSQLIGASPLIRIRLGDLLRSNYSLFALGRLFGMGNQDFTVDGKKFEGDSAIDQGVLNDLTVKIQSQLGIGPTNGRPSGGTYVPAGGKSYPYYDESAAGGISLPAPKIPFVSSADGLKFAPEFKPDDGLSSAPFLVKAKSLHPDNPFLIVGEVMFNDDIGHTDKFTPGLKKWVDENFNNNDIPTKKYIGGTYLFHVSELVPTDQNMAKTIAKLSALSNLDEQNSGFAQAVAEFLNPKNNAIAKSFQDTAGKGLAGFIETMSFDWFDKTTWETEKRRVAPKMCKVTISFSPVHDISPGIDHMGLNRAPVYPVGIMGQGPGAFPEPEGT